MKELTAGQEWRCNPYTQDSSLWLREEVLRLAHDSTAQFPASFDRAIWPRPEDLEDVPAHYPMQAEQAGANALELLPIGISNKNEISVGSDYWRVAVTLVTFHGPISQALRKASEQKYAANQWEMPDGWILVGYDVLDSGLAIGGLLNCGSPPIELAHRILEKTNSRLNRFYLWPNSAIAAEYAAGLDALVPAHAPFDVVGLYLCANDIAKVRA